MNVAVEANQLDAVENHLCDLYSILLHKAYISRMMTACCIMYIHIV